MLPNSRILPSSSPQVSWSARPAMGNTLTPSNSNPPTDLSPSYSSPSSSQLAYELNNKSYAIPMDTWGSSPPRFDSNDIKHHFSDHPKANGPSRKVGEITQKKKKLFRTIIWVVTDLSNTDISYYYFLLCAFKRVLCVEDGDGYAESLSTNHNISVHPLYYHPILSPRVRQHMPTRTPIWFPGHHLR